MKTKRSLKEKENIAISFGKIQKRVLFLICFGFLVYQTILCIKRFLSDETTMSMEIVRFSFQLLIKKKIAAHTCFSFSRIFILKRNIIIIGKGILG